MLSDLPFSLIQNWIFN